MQDRLNWNNNDLFFATISTFHTKDFCNSTNTELNLLKMMIDATYQSPPPPPPPPLFLEPNQYMNASTNITDSSRVDASLPLQASIGRRSSRLDSSTQSPPVSFHNFSHAITKAEPIAESAKRKRTHSPRQGRPKKQGRTLDSPPSVVDSEGDDDSLYSLPHPSHNKSNKNLYTSAAGLQMMRGENRLKIDFLQFGLPGAVPQRFGRNNCIVPDGLCGANHVYDQPWRFEISHVLLIDEDTGEQRTGIKWKIMNLISGCEVEASETVQDANKRETTGRTICNLVLRKAFEARACELEQSLPGLENDPSALAQTESLIKSLRPKRLTVGLLFFGLLHECVQKRLEAMMMTTS